MGAVGRGNRLRDGARADTLEDCGLGQRLGMRVGAIRIGRRVGHRRVAEDKGANVDRLVDVDVLADVHVLEETDVE